MVKRGSIILYNLEELLFIIKKNNPNVKIKAKLAIISEEDKVMPKSLENEYRVSSACMALINEEDDSVIGTFIRYIPIKGGNNLYLKYKGGQKACTITKN